MRKNCLRARNNVEGHAHTAFFQLAYEIESPLYRIRRSSQKDDILELDHWMDARPPHIALDELLHLIHDGLWPASSPNDATSESQKTIGRAESAFVRASTPPHHRNGNTSS